MYSFNDIELQTGQPPVAGLTQAPTRRSLSLRNPIYRDEAISNLSTATNMRLPRHFAPRNDMFSVLKDVLFGDVALSGQDPNQRSYFTWQSGLALTLYGSGNAVRINPDSHESRLGHSI